VCRGPFASLVRGVLAPRAAMGTAQGPIDVDTDNSES
jgi:hypothetical protein